MSKGDFFRSRYTGQEIEERLSAIGTITSQLVEIVRSLNKLGVTNSQQDASIESLNNAVSSMKKTDSEHDAAIAAIRSMLPSSIQFANFTQDEYDHAKETNKLEPKWYFIFQDYQYRRLMRIYYYGTLVARRGDGEVSSGFPYVFPFIF